MFSKFKSTFSSVQFSHSVVSNSLRPHELQHARPPCPSPTPGVPSNPRLEVALGLHLHPNPLGYGHGNFHFAWFVTIFSLILWVGIYIKKGQAIWVSMKWILNMEYACYLFSQWKHVNVLGERLLISAYLT